MNLQFIRFVATGGIAAVVNFGSRVFYNEWMSFSIAVISAYITGMVVAFVLAKLFVFTQTHSTLTRSILMFSIVNLAGVFQVWLFSLILANWMLPALGIEDGKFEIAHGVSIIIPVFTSFLGHKYLTFGQGHG
jgi:putative flippase GtrA